jgi:catechol 2,3-dioxygenase-like lactoylglutathione lyase family enzyme
MILRTDHLNIVVSDLDATRKFFSLLGFSEGISSQLDAAFLEKVTGIQGAKGTFVALHHPGSNLSIELLKFESAPTGDGGTGRADSIGMRHLAFAVTDIEAEVQRLQEHGVRFLSPIQTWEKTGKKLVYFLGPDDILLEFAQYPE